MLLEGSLEGLKLLKAFNYRLSHQDKARFTADLHTEHREGEVGVNGRKANRDEKLQNNVSKVMEMRCWITALKEKK